MKLLKLFIIITIISIYSCNNKKSSSLFGNYPVYYCNFENVTSNGKRFTDKTFSDITYKGVYLKTKEKVRSGKYALKLSKKNKFGMGVTIPIKTSDYFKISVWKYCKNINEGFLVVKIDGKELYIQEKEVVTTDSMGWGKIEIKLRIPPFIKVDEMKIYAWQPDKDNVYYDDLKIEKIKDIHPAKIDSAAIKIFIDNKEYDKLLKIRTKALKIGLLETNDDSWVKAIMFSKDDVFNVKLRLKGDWTDHIKGAKWSFRIKMRKDGAWKGLRIFSIQDPKTRFFQYEWLGHKLMGKEGVLSPRYEFVPVYINNSYMGIYAYEEHFLKQLPESKKRREGPILKLSEEGFWTINKLNKTSGIWYNLPIYESSTILAYKMDKTLKSNTLRNEFIIGQNLLYQLKFCNAKVSELVDVNLAAKYYAIIDLTKMYHGMRWHNQRFYYNPITSKLEIIGYDGYTENGVYTMVQRPIIGYKRIDLLEKIKPESWINYSFFTDSIFIDKYVHYLKKYSDTTFINNLFSNLNSEINQYRGILESEYAAYKFDKNFYYDNAKRIREDLPKYEEKIKSGAYYKISYKNLTKHKIKHQMAPPSLVNEYIKVFTEKKDDNSYTYKIENYLAYDIETVAIKKNDKKSKSYHNIKKTIINNYNSTNNVINITSEFGGNILVIKIKGFDKKYYIKINSWQSPKNESPRQNLLKNAEFPIVEYFTLKNNEVIFKKGNIKVNKNIFIPKGYKVRINAGTNLDFTNNSFFISYSPVFIKGLKNNKVIISSSDSTALGFSIIQPNDKSVVEYTDFINLNTLSYNGWTLTGAVNFYEANVNISNTSFLNNHCEDALNIVRSDFNVSNCFFKDIFSDAFDSDFCTGILTSTNFHNIGNDAIDFSGSVVDISNCIINGTGDKGVSGGEGSTLDVKDCDIFNCKIGIASKDNSFLTVENTNIHNCYYGFVALQKKPEYGPAIIKSSNLKFSDLIKLHLIEKKSKLYLNNKIINGYDKNTAMKFY